MPIENIADTSSEEMKPDFDILDRFGNFLYLGSPVMFHDVPEIVVQIGMRTINGAPGSEPPAMSVTSGNRRVVLPSRRQK